MLELPSIPEKRYFTIGEVSQLCLLKPHILRYWEQEFTHIKPSKRRGRRYYQIDDILIIRTIRQLLYVEGFTISGAKQRLTQIKANGMVNLIEEKQEEGTQAILLQQHNLSSVAQRAKEDQISSAEKSEHYQQLLAETILSLEELLELMK
ncbi:MAG: MerR family transcriptional regulator [Gammaproteobacteria bacterium]|nr:MerR family transcriptional regulator [Gammaproteobacteria bacterium]